MLAAALLLRRALWRFRLVRQAALLSASVGTAGIGVVPQGGARGGRRSRVERVQPQAVAGSVPMRGGWGLGPLSPDVPSALVCAAPSSLRLLAAAPARCPAPPTQALGEWPCRCFIRFLFFYF